MLPPLAAMSCNRTSLAIGCLRLAKPLLPLSRSRQSQAIPGSRRTYVSCSRGSGRRDLLSTAHAICCRAESHHVPLSRYRPSKTSWASSSDAAGGTE
jgi:hypothetical protein